MILRTILHPIILSVLQLRNIWTGQEENKQEIQTYQTIRGCAGQFGYGISLTDTLWLKMFGMGKFRVLAF